jgi:uncharacterized protein with FMN-binding domain
MLGSFGTKRTILAILGTITSLGTVLAITPPRLQDENIQLAFPETEPSTVTPTAPSPASTDPECIPEYANPASPAVIPGLSNDDGEDDEEYEEDEEDEDDEEDEYDDSAEREDDGDEDDEEKEGITNDILPSPSTDKIIPAPCPSTASTSNPNTPKPSSPITNSLRAGSYTGLKVNTRYGPLQVKVTISNGKIISITAPFSPADDGRSRTISATALPVLITQAITAQTGYVNGVSGASYTSEGFRSSLTSALLKAKG